MMKTKILTICALLLLAAGLGACARGDASVGPPLDETVAALMDIATVGRGDIREVHVLPGIVRAAIHTADLEAGSGQVVALYAYQGDHVVQGQVVARIDVSAIEETIQRSEDAITHAQTLHRLQTTDRNLEIEILELNHAAAGGDEAARLLERIEWLRLDLSHMQRRHARAMAEAQANLDELVENLSHYLYHSEIRAPIDGIVVYIHSYVGGHANENHPVIMSIACHDEIFVESIRPGTTIDRNAVFTKIQGHTENALFDLERISISTAQQRHYSTLGLPVSIRFEILAPQNEMPQMGETVFIRLYEAVVDDVLRIPSNAIFSDVMYGNFVYRIEDGRRVMTPVTVGTQSTSYVEILEGLYEGCEVFVNP